ncbi:MAG: hypothetical protein ACO1N7_11000 [Sphingobacteriaceae bacterium]
MKITALCLSILLPVIAFSQSNYKSGYIIKTNGDTLKGLINYKEWQHSPKSIKFRLGASGQSQEFSVEEIKRFEINGLESYISYIGMISTDLTRFPNVSAYLDTSRVLDTVLLRQVTTGKFVTLYSHKDKVKERYFISQSGNAPTELRYHQYYNANNQIATLDYYKITLDSLQTKFQPGNVKLKKKIQDSKFTSYNLVEIFNILNGNEKIKKKGSTRLFIGIAANYNITEFRGDNTFAGLQEVSISPEISGGFDVFINPVIQKTIFRMELGLWAVNPSFSKTSKHGGMKYFYSFNQYTASITPQLIYNVYNSNTLKIFLNAGIALNYSLYAKNDAKTIIGTKTFENDPYDLESMWTHFPFKAGFVLSKKIEVFAGYTPRSSFSNYIEFGLDNTKYSAGIKYLFNRHFTKSYQ